MKSNQRLVLHESTRQLGYSGIVRFRVGRASDFDRCAAMLDADRSLPLDDAYRRGLPRKWATIFDSLWRGAFMVVEGDDDDGSAEPAIVAFAMSVFVHAAFVKSARERARPYLAMRFYDEHLTAQLSEREVRRANSEGELHLLGLHFCHRHRALDAPETVRVFPILTQAFHFSHAGYRFRSMTIEVSGKDGADFMTRGGYRLLSDYPDSADSRLPHAPHLMGLDRVDTGPGANLLDLQILHADAPRFHFAPAEQRLLIFALLGASDRELARDLEVSLETVRSTWRTIYTRVGRVLPRLLHGTEAEGRDAAVRAVRGEEKRRRILDYVRQHMEEVRPVEKRRS